MVSIDVKKTGTNIRTIMERKGVTVADVRDACGFTTGNAVYKWLNGTCMPTIDNMVIVADVLGATLDDLVAVAK